MGVAGACGQGGGWATTRLLDATLPVKWGSTAQHSMPQHKGMAPGTQGTKVHKAAQHRMPYTYRVQYPHQISMQPSSNCDNGEEAHLSTQLSPLPQCHRGHSTPQLRTLAHNSPCCCARPLLQLLQATTHASSGRCRATPALSWLWGVTAAAAWPAKAVMCAHAHGGRQGERRRQYATQ
jgi:hypothetical protein